MDKLTIQIDMGFALISPSNDIVPPGGERSNGPSRTGLKDGTKADHSL